MTGKVKRALPEPEAAKQQKPRQVKRAMSDPVMVQKPQKVGRVKRALRK